MSPEPIDERHRCSCGIMDILLVGAYPPPLGGNTVHIQRLLSFLIDMGHRVKVLDCLGEGAEEKRDAVNILPQGPTRKLLSVVGVAKHTTVDTIIHVHVSAMGRFRWLFPLLLSLFRKQAKIITIHSGSFVAQTNHPSGRFYLRWLLSYFCKIITVTQEQSDYLARIGIPTHKLMVIPAFLPQTPVLDLVPQTIADEQGKRMLVLASGFLTRLYNYDVLIDCIERLGTEDYAFIFAFYNESEPAYEQHICGRLSEFSNIIILRDQSPEVFVSVVSVCDIYVRTAITDGDAVAIREALHFGKAVFATDCVRRPDACRTFSSSDSDSLLKLFQECRESAMAPSESNCGSNAEQILKVYRETQRETGQSI